MDIRLKRAYEPAASSDGYRVLIDRLWPRGVSRKLAKLDAWERELAPSTELRQWFGHQPNRFDEFRRRYIAELGQQRQRLTELRRRARDGNPNPRLCRPRQRAQRRRRSRRRPATGIAAALNLVAAPGAVPDVSEGIPRRPWRLLERKGEL